MVDCYTLSSSANKIIAKLGRTLSAALQNRGPKLHNLLSRLCDTVLCFIYTLVKGFNWPRVFLPAFGIAIRALSISFTFPNMPAYQSFKTEND